MKAKELIERLKELVIEHGNLELIYGADDEGNEYNTVQYSASVCKYENEEREEVEKGEKPTHICIN